MKHYLILYIALFAVLLVILSVLLFKPKDDFKQTIILPAPVISVLSCTNDTPVECKRCDNTKGCLLESLEVPPCTLPNRMWIDTVEGRVMWTRCAPQMIVLLLCIAIGLTIHATENNLVSETSEIIGFFLLSFLLLAVAVGIFYGVWVI